MTLTVREDLKAYIDPLTPEEHEALERSLLAEGCRDALVVWGDVLVDGHNRHAICTKHGLPFKTVQNPHFQSLEDVHLWMIDQHLGRRSVSNFQRGLLALRKSEILAERRTRATAEAGTSVPAPQEPAAAAGADELKQAAKRVREAKCKPREVAPAVDEGAATQAEPEAVQALRQRVAELTAENEALRRELAALKAGAPT